MTPQEHELIADLFRRLKGAPDVPVDQEARAFIERQIAEQPVAPYLLTQTTLVQEHALKGAQNRIAELEAELAARSEQRPQRSFLSGMLGNADERPARRAAVGPWAAQPPAAPPPQAAPAGTPWSAAGQGQSPGGGFLRSAMATAAGVAGGALLFQGIEHMLGYGGSPFAHAGMMGSGLAPREDVTINNYYDQRGGSADDDTTADDDNADTDAQDASYGDDDSSDSSGGDDGTNI